MYVVEILDALGDPAEFVVVSPVVALDLALRAQRAGLRWRVVDESSTRSLPIEDLRHVALRFAARDPAASEHLRQAECDNERAVVAALN
ncbi:MAG: hypothetical protein ACRDV1_00050 [Actinomycetes bacterium]